MLGPKTEEETGDGRIFQNGEVNSSCCFIKHHGMKMYRGVEVYLHALLVWALD
jgi:hypothetical protein